jgi:hypothetical protein
MSHRWRLNACSMPAWHVAQKLSAALPLWRGDCRQRRSLPTKHQAAAATVLSDKVKSKPEAPAKDPTQSSAWIVDVKHEGRVDENGSRHAQHDLM